MKRIITIGALALLSLGAFAQEAEKVLVVKPVLGTKQDTSSDWGGKLGADTDPSVDPRYEMKKVEGYENLYSCTLTLDKYFKSNKWASKWGEEVGFLEDGVTPNEGWSDNHQFVAVYRDEYGDQDNKNNPHTNPAQNFVLAEDGTEVTFYALVNEAGDIRSCCDAQSVYITLQNNEAGGVQLPAVIGQTFSRETIVIGNTNNAKIESSINKHILNPDGNDKKYGIWTRGRHVMEVNFLTINYTIHKVLDEIANPQITFDDTALTGNLGTFNNTGNIMLSGSLEGTINTTAGATVSMDSTKAYLAYEIIPAGEENGTVNRIALATEAMGNVTSASWNSEDLAISLLGLAAGEYTLKAWLETVSWGDVLVADNEGEGYTATFTVEVGDDPTTGLNNPTLQANISTAAQTILATFEGSADVKLYSVSGQLLDEQQVNGTYTKAVNPGIYVIAVAEKAYKVVVK